MRTDLTHFQGKSNFRFKDLFVFKGFKPCGTWLEHGHILVELKRTTKTGQCPKCGKRRRKSIQSYDRIVRDLDVSGIPCYIRFEEFRISCFCGYRGMEELEFCEKYVRVTKRFVERVVILCQKMCIKDVAGETGLHWTTVKNIDKKAARKYIISLDKVNPTRIGVDEIAYKKRHKYLSVVRDVDLGKVIWVGEGRRKVTLDQFFQELGKMRSKAVKVVVMDMWDPYIASVRENTDADIVFDKFHIAKKVNGALDTVRRRAFAKADEKERKRMKRKRFLILSRKDRLSEEKKETLEDLMKVNKQLYQAYLLKEQILDILDEENLKEALKRLDKWFRNVTKAKFVEFLDVMNTLKKYFYGVVNFFKHHLTNAASEGFNTKINVIKRRAYGFRDLEYFKLKILQSCGIFSSKNA